MTDEHDNFDSSYVPSENESPEKDGHVYVTEWVCDTCKMELMTTTLENKACPTCGEKAAWLQIGFDGFWLEKDDFLEDAVIIQHMILPDPKATDPDDKPPILT